jgi:hypothetical protein
MAESDFKCGNCEYFVNLQIMGVCRLYPMQQNKHETDWCGQHKHKQTLVREYNILTDEVRDVVVPRLKRKYTKKSDV